MEAWRQGVVSGSTLVNASMLNGDFPHDPLSRRILGHAFHDH